MRQLFTLYRQIFFFTLLATTFPSFSQVTPIPGPQSIMGPTAVCLGVPISFSVPNDPPPGIKTQWEIENGIIINGNPGPKITVVFTVNPTGPLKVRARNHNGNAFSPWVTLTVHPMIADFQISGSVAPRSSSYETYSVDEAEGDKYTWSIRPEYLGSVVNYPQEAEVEILWNNVSAPTVATIIVAMEKCGHVYTKAFRVTVHPHSKQPVSRAPKDCKTDKLIVAPDHACLGTPVSFRTPVDDPDLTYHWDFDDAAYNSQRNPVRVFGSGGVFHVILTISDANGCKVVSHHRIDIKENEMDGYLMEPQQRHYPGDTIVLFYNPTNLFDLPTRYHWNHNGTTTTTDTGVFFVTEPGEYVLDVENRHGCIVRRIDNVYIEFFDPPHPSEEEKAATPQLN